MHLLDSMKLKQTILVRMFCAVHRFMGTFILRQMIFLKLCREEQDLLEILDLELFGVKILISILIDSSLATVILLDSCLFEEYN